MKNLQIFRIDAGKRMSSSVKHFDAGITTTKTDLDPSIVKSQLTRAVKLGFPTAPKVATFEIEFDKEVLYRGTLPDLFKNFGKYQQSERVAVALTEFFDLKASLSTTKEEKSEANKELTEVKKQAILLLGVGGFKYTMQTFTKTLGELNETAEKEILRRETELKKKAEEVK